MTRIPEEETPRLYAFGPFRMDVPERRLSRDGNDLALTRKTFDLLLALIEGAGRLQTREALIGTLWPDTIVEEHSLTWHLSALRKALGDTGDAPSYIETVRGHGYRFIAAVEDVGAAAPAAVADSPLPQPSALATAPASSDPRPAADSTASPQRRIPGLLLLGLLAILVGLIAWQASRRPGSSDRSIGASPRSLAVLPFENLSTDPGNAYFVSGIEDILLAKLAGIADLRVISRRSTETYQSRPADLHAVAEQLNVAAVLEGSVQKDGDRVLIAVQLIDGASGNHLWAQSYTRTLDNVFEIESEVAEQIAAALKAKLLPAEAERVASEPTRDAQAYDQFLRAEYIAAQIESETAKDPTSAHREARGLYEQAIASDPRFALAHAKLSYLQSRAYWYDIDHTAQAIAMAESEARLALALEPDLPQSHFAMGYVQYYGQRDYAAALKSFERAQQGLPGDGYIGAAIASIQRRQGRWDEALAGFERAALLDPRNPHWSTLLGDTLTVQRRYDEAVKAYDRAQAVNPNDYTAAIYKSLALLLDGKLEQAEQTLAALPHEIDPGGLASTLRFEVARIAANGDAALAALASAPEWVEAPYAPAFVPTNLLRAQALELKNDSAGALENFAKARDALRDALREQPDHPALLSLLALAEAGVGEKENALRDARRATELLTIAQDAMDSPSMLAAQAEVYARVGDDVAAVHLLRDLLAMPAGRVISVPLIERDPRFRSLRERVLASVAAE